MPRRPALTPSRFRAFKYVIYGLLVLNTLVYFEFGSLTETIDSVAWLSLVALFEYETTHLARTARTRLLALVLHLLRYIAYAAILYAAIGYAQEQDWLSAANAWIWIVLVLVIEAEVRLVEHDRGIPRPLTLTKWLSVLALLGIAVAWGLHGELLDLYDALLWLAAFLFIDLNLLDWTREETAAGPA